MNAESKTHSSTLIKIQTAFVCLVPAALVTGPFLSDLFCIISSLLFLYTSLRLKLFKYYLNVPVYIFLFFCFIFILISLLSSNPKLSLESSLFYFRFGLFALSIWYLLEVNHLFLKQFSIILTITLFIVLIDAYIQFSTGSNILGFKYNGTRVSGFFNEELKLGMYLAHFLPLYFGLMMVFTKNEKTIIFICMIFLILTDILVFLSGERTAFFKLTLSTALIILLVKKWKVIRIITFVLSILIISYITFTETSVKSRMIDLTSQQLGLQENNQHVFSPGYEALYSTSYKIFLDNPIIGIGPKMFREVCAEDKYRSLNSCSTHPHNSYLQLLTETGVVGFIFLFSAFTYVSIKLLRSFFSNFFNSKNLRLSDTEICLYIATFIYLWPIMPSLNFFNNWINVIYFLPIGFLLYFKNK